MRLAQLAQLLVVVLAAIAVYGFVRAAQADQRRSACTALCALNPAYGGRDRLAPDFELPDLGGKPVRLSSFRGRTVVLNFWTKTCAPCLEEMPALADLARALERDGNAVLLTINTDEGPDAVRDTLTTILRAEAPPFAVLFDPESEVVRGRYGTTLFPETWIIDPRGVIRARFDGKRDWSSPLALDVITSMRRRPDCPVDFRQGRARGTFASLCDG